MLECFQPCANPGTFTPDDLTVQVGAQYDDAKLYLGIKVRDQSHFQERASLNGWSGDFVQVCLGAGASPAGWQSWQRIYVGMDSRDGTLFGGREVGDPGGPLKRDDVDYAVRREGDETWYEIAIPWKNVGGGLSTVPAEGILGLSVAVIDRDLVEGQPNKQKYCAALGNVGEPAKFGILQLEKK